MRHRNFGDVDGEFNSGAIHGAGCGAVSQAVETVIMTIFEAS
jgi:hypothetical protein